MFVRQTLYSANYLDAEANPAGGEVRGEGLSIDWQNGPLSVDGVRRQPNGAFVEGVIEAAKQRLEHYQETKFACGWNKVAIDHLNSALAALEARTSDRTVRGVEGSHEL